MISSRSISSKSISSSLHSFINDTTINDALEKWKKMFDLYQNKTIDEEVYRLWVEKTLREYNIPYHPNGGVRSEYNGDDYDGDNELPFN